MNRRKRHNRRRGELTARARLRQGKLTAAEARVIWKNDLVLLAWLDKWESERSG